MSKNWKAFTDGACRGNPGPGGWALSATDGVRVVELAGFEAATTNNRMELQAALETLQFFKAEAAVTDTLEIFTDSELMIRSLTEWLPGWKARGWARSTGEPVKNIDLLERLDPILKDLGKRVSWTHVRGHAGIPGNERVDALAVSAATQDGSEVPFVGMLKDFSYQNIFETTSLKSADSHSPKKSSSQKSKKSGTVWYVSFVGGVLERHSTWADCERRVKGASGARYKKVSSDSEESECLKAWGVKS
jgi:ribonuclease HI